VVIVEIALSFVLLTGSGLMFRSFLALQRIDPGYKAHGLLTFQLLGSRGGNQPEQRAAFVRSIQDHLRALPGVESVTASAPFPLTGGINATRWGKEEALADPSKYQAADFLTVLPGYFETLQTRLIEGRTFTEADNSPDRTVAVIDQTLAAKAFPHESAVGRRILLLLRNNVQPDVLEVIGVVAHQRDTSLAEPGREQIYITDGFRSHGVVARWAVRTAGDPAKLAPAVRAEIAKISGGLLITEVQPMDALVDKAQAGTRFSFLLIGVFAMIAALLAGVGLYGVLSTVVRQRTAEIGVRLTLGSSPMGIVGLVAGHGLRLCAVGIAAGVISAFALTRTLSSMLVGVKATDRTTFALMAMLFFFIAAMASWLPARRAARLDPTAALREE
jgi:putative ABC transport system permease protein